MRYMRYNLDNERSSASAPTGGMMAINRTLKLRRPMRVQLQPRSIPVLKTKGTTGMVPAGTKGIYDSNPKVRSSVARAMVSRRSRIEVKCDAEGCIDPSTGEPRRFISRVVNGKPERRGCCPAHRLRIWRKDMRDKGYRQATVDGQIGWMTPNGVFYPNPSQPVRHRLGSRRRRARNTQVATQASMEVTPESE
jgi:hypothetical protein